MKILGYDVNGGWDINQYSPQQGHIIKFFISEDKKTKSREIRKIVWNLNGEIFEGETASHIFKKNGEPGQGYVTVKCKSVLFKI